MGIQTVETPKEERLRLFMRRLLEDLQVLDDLLESDHFERGVRRIGAEQEMFIVDESGLPCLKSQRLLDELEDERFTPELGQFNLEANLKPLELKGDCLRQLEAEVTEVVTKARRVAQQNNANIVLTGILPTLRRAHLGLEAMMPLPRYFSLNEALKQMRGSDFNLQIKGIDLLEVSHDNLMLEACNTSFQVHFQVAPEEFAHLYNLAQLVTAPLMAVAVNSPLLLGKRLWHETRIAVFEHSVDTRSEIFQERGQLPRVHFGDKWVDESVIEIFKEDIARFRVLQAGDKNMDFSDQPPDQVPELKALRLHNGTVYRWNRACYGIHNGKAHLRIENRVIPSGPTVLDEIANAAFFFGMLSSLSVEITDIREKISFEDVYSNFMTAAREGLRAQFTWIDGEHIPAAKLIQETLLPMAERGLQRMNINEVDIQRYLGVIQKRIESRQTGARWMLDSFNAMKDQGTLDQRTRQLVTAMIESEQKGAPIHEWPLADFCSKQDWRESYRTVGSFMTTDLFTVRPDDLVDFAASLMDWKHIRHVPVEDDSGQLVGLISHRSLLRIISQGLQKGNANLAVKDIMSANPVVVSPETSTVEVIQIMRTQKLGCLPVVRNGKLVGIVSERDLIGVAGKLLEDHLSNDPKG